MGGSSARAKSLDRLWGIVGHEPERKGNVERRVKKPVTRILGESSCVSVDLELKRRVVARKQSIADSHE